MRDLSKIVEARASWSRLSEPGDRVLGALLEFLDPELALDLFLENKLLDKKIVDAVVLILDSYGYNPKANFLIEAVSRWESRRKYLDVARDLDVLSSLGGEILVPENVHWPVMLVDLGLEAPVCLWVRGSVEFLANDMISIVGSRNASAYGKRVSEDIVIEFVNRDISVVSGGAYGIDGVVHSSVLNLGGATVAVMAGGVDRYYPRGHESLLKDIAHKGVVVSEVALGVSPTRWRFLQRNRIIAALSKATVVVEAGWRSGALNTANHANRLLRVVGAVPGPVDSPTSAGCHKLLRSNAAICVTDSLECLELLGFTDVDSSKKVRSSVYDSLAVIDVRLFDIFSYGKWYSVSELAALAGISEREAMISLGRLSLIDLVYQKEKFWSKNKI